MENPFSLNFGKEPFSFIDRDENNIDIIESFKAQNSEFQVCMLTGVRGSGKTVSMTAIANSLRRDEPWIVVDLNLERDLLLTLAAELYKRNSLRALWDNARLSLGFPGVEVELNRQPVINDVAVSLGDALECLTKQGKKLLITIDEVANNKNLREFVSQFQIYMRKNYNVYLLMTGLYENIYDLQNEKTLTFLYRAPKLEMKPLSIPMIMLKYQELLGVNSEEALAMAKLTNGYPYAYQVLGYLCFKKQTSYAGVLAEYDIFLQEYVYQKIWSELSELDKEFLLALAKSTRGKAGEIKRLLDMPTNKYSVYRDRLLKKGLIKSIAYGCLELILPRFDLFVLQQQY